MPRVKQSQAAPYHLDTDKVEAYRIGSVLEVGTEMAVSASHKKSSVVKDIENNMWFKGVGDDVQR